MIYRTGRGVGLKRVLNILLNINYAVVFICLLVMVVAQAGPLTETRYCGDPARDADGRIIRSPSVLYWFKKMHPCPATGETSGACPGWAMDHIIPLVCGGCDEVANLQWLPDAVKSAGGDYPKDRWEQRVYCDPKFLHSAEW